MCSDMFLVHLRILPLWPIPFHTILFALCLYHAACACAVALWRLRLCSGASWSMKSLLGMLFFMQLQYSIQAVVTVSSSTVWKAAVAFVFQWGVWLFHQVFFFGFFFLPSERMILKCNTMWGWNSSRNTVRITVLESVKSVYYWIIFCSVVEKMWLLWMGRLNHELNWYFRCWVHQLFISESTQGIIKKIIIKKLIKLHTNELHFNCFSNA